MASQVKMGDLDSDVNGRYFLGADLFSGEAVELAASGSVVTLTTYVDGVEQGPHRLWHENGTLEFSCELHDGNPVGLAFSWRTDGTLEEEQEFDEAGNLLWSRRRDESGGTVEDTAPRSA